MSAAYAYEITTSIAPREPIFRFETTDREEALRLVSNAAALLQESRGKVAPEFAERFLQSAGSTIALAEQSGRADLSCPSGSIAVDADPIHSLPATYIVCNQLGSAYWLDGDTLACCPVAVSGDLRLSAQTQVDWTEPEDRPLMLLIRWALERLTGSDGPVFAATAELGTTRAPTLADFASALLRSSEAIEAGETEGRLYAEDGELVVGNWALAPARDIDTEA